MVILSDEVYERLHYTDIFPRIATLDHEIAKHTLTVGSVGKAFNATGWRVGYVIGNEHLIKHVRNAHTALCYTTAGPAQEAAAVGFEEADQRGFWESNKENFKREVESFCEVLQELGLPVCGKACSMIKPQTPPYAVYFYHRADSKLFKFVQPSGAYFVFINTRKIQIPPGYEFPPSVSDKSRDIKICWFLIQELGVTTIPGSGKKHHRCIHDPSLCT